MRILETGGLAVFAVEHVAHDTAALGVLLRGAGLAAGGTAVGKAGLAGAQLELVPAGDAGFDGKSHDRNMVAKLEGRVEGAWWFGRPFPGQIPEGWHAPFFIL